jgi:hypothetical protein
VADEYPTTTEIWRTIERWPRYEVSNHGRILSHWWNPPRLLKPSPDLQGRLRITVTDEDRNHKTPRVHVLVAQLFLGPKPEGLEINHKDGIYTNNRDDNLEYCTSERNEEHALEHGLKPHGERVGTSKLTEDQVRQIRRIYPSVKSSRQVARMFGVTKTTILRVVNRHRWKHVD